MASHHAFLFFSYGDSALHLAARIGSMGAVQALLELGIDDSLQSQHGTALDVAKRASNKVSENLPARRAPAGKANHVSLSQEVARLLEEWRKQDPDVRKKRRLTFSDVGLMVEGMFSAAYLQATKPPKGWRALSPPDEERNEDQAEESSSEVSSLSAGGSEASSLKSSQSAPPSLDSSLANEPDHTALIDSIVASLSHISVRKGEEASSLKSSQSETSNPPSLTSSASHVEAEDTSTAVVDTILASIFSA